MPQASTSEPLSPAALLSPRCSYCRRAPAVTDVGYCAACDVLIATVDDLPEPSSSCETCDDIGRVELACWDGLDEIDCPDCCSDDSALTDAFERARELVDDLAADRRERQCEDYAARDCWSPAQGVSL